MFMETAATNVRRQPKQGPWALRELPAFPAVATRVLQLLAREDVSVQSIVDIIRTDPAFSAGVMRVANSALFGLVCQVETVRHAIVVVGLDRVRSLTLTVALGSYLRSAMRVEVLRRCWKHSIACAVLSEELAPACAVAPDLAYTAGLLHDAGRLGLLVAYPAEYGNLLAVAEENSFDVMQTERDLFDIDHCEAGAWLMNEWQFPPELYEAAAGHHSEPEPGGSGLLNLSRIACRFADALGYEVVKHEHRWDLEAIAAMLPEPARSNFKPDPDALRARIGSLVDSLD